MNKCSESSENDDTNSIGECDSSIDKCVQQIYRNIKPSKEGRMATSQNGSIKSSFLANRNNISNTLHNNKQLPNSLWKEDLIKNAKGHYIAANKGDSNNISGLISKSKSNIYEEGEGKITKDEIIEISFEDFKAKKKSYVDPTIEQPDDFSDKNSTNMSYYNSISEVFDCFQEIKARKAKQKQYSTNSTRPSEYNTASFKESSCGSKVVKKPASNGASSHPFALHKKNSRSIIQNDKNTKLNINAPLK